MANKLDGHTLFAYAKDVGKQTNALEIEIWLVYLLPLVTINKVDFQ